MANPLQSQQTQLFFRDLCWWFGLDMKGVYGFIIERKPTGEFTARFQCSPVEEKDGVSSFREIEFSEVPNGEK